MNALPNFFKFASVAEKMNLLKQAGAIAVFGSVMDRLDAPMIAY
jgi:hypothetical protein